jgi:hypothetical protein
MRRNRNINIPNNMHKKETYPIIASTMRKQDRHAEHQAKCTKNLYKKQDLMRN